MDEKQASEYGCNIGDKIILIQPGSTILAHTREYIGGKNNITTMMKARSSLGRSSVSICKCAGWGDVGYVNRWTMEIQNSSKSILVLIVGQRVGQIIFFNTGDVINPYNIKGSYQHTSHNNLEKIIESWKPEMMLPNVKYEHIEN